jgi:hypothetical protein
MMSHNSSTLQARSFIMGFRRRFPIVLTAALLASFTIPAAISDADPVLRSDGATRSLQQRPLVAAAETLQAELTDLPGFAGITLADKEVLLWWKGDVPAAAGQVVERASLRAPVRVAAAAHSQTELAAAAEKVNAWRKANPGAGVYAVKNPGDGSGLVLSAYPGIAQTSAAHVDAGVPLRVVHEEPMTPTARKDDAAPWKGGAGTWNQTNSTICTAGFGVRNSANARFVLSAEHCGQVGHRITDRVGEFIGNVGAGRDDHDISIIPTSDTANRMYVGDGNSNSTVTVTGWGHVFVGQFLCQSGVTSAEQTGGPVCNLKVLFFYQDAEDLVEAEQTNGQPAARGGDSGGSVYSVVSGGVVANGTVTRSAGARLGFQDFATANRDFGVYIP